MSSSRQIDVKHIKIVRSAKDNDMLLVDDYLYHYEDRGQNSFRWVCAKRKAESCRARLVTTPIDNESLEHEVIRIVGEHCHHRNTKEQIEKAIRRKEWADESGKPGTLISKLLERKIRKINHTLEKIEPAVETKKKTPAAEKPTFAACDSRNKSLKMLTHNEVYVLKTHQARELVCVNGYLYRLEGKSKTSATFRWECIRSDIACKTRIYTECFDKIRHTLRQLTGVTIRHDHEALTPRKLSRMIEKHKLTVVDNSENFCVKIDETLAMSHVDTDSSPTACVTLDPLNFNPHVIYSKSILNNKDIMLLPSAKGNQVLCVDNMIYHYDSPSPCNSRIYWTCMMRRDKHYRCNARIITEDSDNGLQIKKMSGRHEHADHSIEIKRRLRRVKTPNDNESKHIKKFRSFKTLTISDEDSISSCDTTFSNELIELPARLEDMRHIEKEEKIDDCNPGTPERIDFVEQIDTHLFETECNYEDMITPAEDVRPIKRGRKRKLLEKEIVKQSIDLEMNLSKVSHLRTAKQDIYLNVDGYIYQFKRQLNERSYWMCLTTGHEATKCKCVITTINSNKKSNEVQVIHVTNKHNHATTENFFKKKFCNELATNSKSNVKMNKNDGNFANEKEDQVELRKMKLYAVSDGPPSLAVRMTLKALNIPFELINVDYIASEHMSESYAKMNPQKEIPVLNDNGFYLSESIAIMQYLCDKYAPENEIYPKDATARALVNQRLCFNMGFYYASIAMHAMAPIFFDYPRNEMSLKKVNNALAVFETYLKRAGTKYAAANHVTIADFALVAATLCLEGIGFDLSPYPLVKTWYETFKKENSAIWEIGNGGMQEIVAFEKNPPDLSAMNHPFHPTKPRKA